MWLFTSAYDVNYNANGREFKEDFERRIRLGLD